jgi:hypothetical protein
VDARRRRRHFRAFRTHRRGRYASAGRPRDRAGARRRGRARAVEPGRRQRRATRWRATGSPEAARVGAVGVYGGDLGGVDGVAAPARSRAPGRVPRARRGRRRRRDEGVHAVDGRGRARFGDDGVRADDLGGCAAASGALETSSQFRPHGGSPAAAATRDEGAHAADRRGRERHCVRADDLVGGAAASGTLEDVEDVVGVPRARPGASDRRRTFSRPEGPVGPSEAQRYKSALTAHCGPVGAGRSLPREESAPVETYCSRWYTL